VESEIIQHLLYAANSICDNGGACVIQGFAKVGEGDEKEESIQENE
jgi:hypothetical protein